MVIFLRSKRSSEETRNSTGFPVRKQVFFLYFIFVSPTKVMLYSKSSQFDLSIAISFSSLRVYEKVVLPMDDTFAHAIWPEKKYYWFINAEQFLFLFLFMITLIHTVFIFKSTQSALWEHFEIQYVVCCTEVCMS